MTRWDCWDCGRLLHTRFGRIVHGWWAHGTRWATQADWEQNWTGHLRDHQIAFPDKPGWTTVRPRRLNGEGGSC